MINTGGDEIGVVTRGEKVCELLITVAGSWVELQLLDVRKFLIAPTEQSQTPRYLACSRSPRYAPHLPRVGNQLRL